MDLIFTIRDLISALRARDFAAAAEPFAKLLEMLAAQLRQRKVIGDTAGLEAALADLDTAIAEVANDTPAVFGANGELLKKLLKALLLLLPLVL